MRKLLLVIVLVSCVSICFAQGNSFDDFKTLFKKIEVPFVLDSCSVEDLVAQYDKFPKITKRMKNYIPKAIQEELFKEQSVRAYYNIPISDNYVSLIMYAGSYMDDYRVTNSVFYLVNYDFKGDIIDYIRIASYICEGGHSWCSINHDEILCNSYEFYNKPLPFKYEIHVVIPMIESRLKYSISTDGCFSKEVLFYRKGIYKPTYNGCYFEFLRNFPEE
jgi:hypothetical protein